MPGKIMNRKRFRVILQVMSISLVMLILFSGCGMRRKADGDGDGQVPATPAEDSRTPESGPEETGSEHTGTVPDDAKDAEETTDGTPEHENAFGNGSAVNPQDPEIEDFLALDEFFIYYGFDVHYDEQLEFYERVYTIRGTYDMDGDGEEDSILALINTGYSEGSYIEVNGNRLMLDHGNFSGEMQLIDLDSRDSYTEIAVFDDGPSADPLLQFYRYDGEKVYFVGSIDRYSLMDGKGRFISSFHLASNFHPQFYSAWGEFRNGEYVTTNADVGQYIGKTFEIDGSGFFVPLDKMPADLSEYLEHVLWDWDAVREFSGTEAKILNIYMNEDDRTLNWFYIELVGGEKGLLYFWIG
ncbi:MAG TPA: hypothetical protein PLP87_10245, partial [Clostridiales bacterium]|nr:hypothetical protein [Clostridiales bacterium]